ncbi:MAG: hypothetical protein JW958_09500 [Candidatus Eisenbacteria bacterium]|nr:hypothetical protein [Candidatus Eisenbacteria bacterium]
MSPILRSIVVTASAAAFLLFSVMCDSGPDRNDPDNPLDPLNPATGGDPFRVSAKYEAGKVELTWNQSNLSGIGGFTVFRRTEFESLFARVDTAGMDATSWTDNHPAYFARAWYRIAALGVRGDETDTTGRAPDSIDVPPLLKIAGGAATTALREVNVQVAAERATEMMLSEDSLLADAAWEPFDTLRTWTFPAEPGDKTLYLVARRENGVVSDTVSDGISPAKTAGKITLAGGDSTIARVAVSVEIRATLPTTIVLSEDSTFHDAGDSVFLYDGATSAQPLAVTWIFNDEPVAKTLVAEIANEFEAETLSASVDPDLLEGAEVRFSWDDSITGECDVPVELEANAILMRLASTQNELLTAPWESYRSEATWAVGPTEGTYEVWVQYENDFATRWLYDRILFVPTPLSIVITEPSDSTEFHGGDTLSLAGEIVNASCRETPDSVTVTAPDTVFTVPNGDAGWTALWLVGDSPAETTAVTLVVETTDEADTTAVDTVLVLILPNEQ